MKTHFFLGIGIVALGALIFWYLTNTPELPTLAQLGVVSESTSLSVEEKHKKYTKAAELVEPDGYINTDGITLEELIGKKVVILDIWTYSCINCQRTLPYINAWYDKYRDQGLEIIGVHTPEFAFEEIYDNVVAAVEKYGIKYPVVQDNDYKTWNAYANRFWPRKFIIDIDGFVVYDHIGEGGYEETEKVIQELLEERRQRLGIEMDIASDTVDPENTETVRAHPKSPEIYFGSRRNQWLGNGAVRTGDVQTLSIPASIQPNRMYLEGDWTFFPEYAENASGAVRIIFQYEAEKVFMVAGAGEPVTMTILRDGEPLGAAAGQSVVDGKVTVDAEGLYRLIEDPAGLGQHTMEIIIENPGLQVFTFTFG
jgi:thiol-disulfide isomerase/thioredoxin